MEHYFTNNENLKSELRDIKFIYDEYNFMFKSDNGVFSKNRIDYASEFLVKTFLNFKDNDYDSILDIGCGYGFIGITLSKILNKHVDMADVNKRCIHLTKMNKDLNKVDISVIESNIYDNIDKTYDLIITNPPIRAGKEILYEFLNGGIEKLNKNGELWFVINKDQGAKSVKKHLEMTNNVKVIDKSKGFWIFLVKK